MSETLVLKSELETTSDIDLLDVCLSSGDFADLAQVIQANGYRGTRKFRTFSGDVKAFGSDIAKGESVDVVVTDSLIYDKGFDYGFVRDGVAYSQNGGKIVGQVKTRNLAYGGSYEGTINGVNINYGNGIFTLKGTANPTIQPDNEIYKKTVTLKAGTYTVRRRDVKGGMSGNSWFNLYVNGKKTLTNFVNTQFVLEEDSSIYIGVAVYEKTNVDYTDSIQIESGSTSTSWVPPLQDVTCTLQLPSEALQPQQSGDDWLVPAKDEDGNDGLLNLTTLTFTAV